MIRYIWLLIWCEFKTDVVFPRTLALKNHYMTGINKVIYITQRCRAEDMNIRIGPLWQANFLTTSKWWHWHKYIHFNANKYINYWVSWMHIIECVRKFHLRPSQPTLMSHISSIYTMAFSLYTSMPVAGIWAFITAVWSKVSNRAG